MILLRKKKARNQRKILLRKEEGKKGKQATKTKERN